MFLIYKEIQKGAVPKSCMTNGHLNMVKYLRKFFFIYDFATDPIWLSFYMKKISFSFLSVQNTYWVTEKKTAGRCDFKIEPNWAKKISPSLDSVLNKKSF
jgi:hypothetical protein